MRQSIRRPFTVTSVADDHVWLKLMKGEKRGLEFAAYASQSTLEDLTPGEKVEVTLRSENSQGTKWGIENITHVDDQASRRTMTADD